MSEILKLRQRLKNTTKTATEYRMTVAEARNLLLEIDALIKPVVLPTTASPIKQEKPAEPVLDEPTVTIRIIDGGDLKGT
jgi:hypothetical protein